MNNFIEKIQDSKKISNDEITRKRKILSLILLGSIFIIGYLNYTVIRDSFIYKSDYDGVPLFITNLVFLFIIFLYIICKKNYVTLSSYLILSIYLGAAIGSSLFWGVSLPACLLTYSFIIITSGILINRKFSLLITITIILILIIIGGMEIISGNIALWKTYPIRVEDVFEYIAILLLIMIITWISSREIEQSLLKAQESERLLIKEKDFLEIKIEKRTQEIRDAQINHLRDLHEHSELGKIAQGIFHDIIGPISTISLYLKEITNFTPNSYNIRKTEAHVKRLLEITAKMKSFLNSVERNIRSTPSIESFDPKDEIHYALDMTEFRAYKLEVKIDFNTNLSLKLIGPSVRFYQVVFNLLSNTLDIFQKTSQKKGMIIIKTYMEKDFYCINFQDNGPGIPPIFKEALFEKPFSTKQNSGLGLFIIKKIITEEFNGFIETKSDMNGTTFFIKIPINQSIQTAQSVYPPKNNRPKRVRK
ncbi:MAG: HAMP domain-containing histidine kinase [Candidatus Taylorbacteria bacterium]|nr:HAMP domain-containing histidine kinase [Candidatus Taylorbacteria bacterium]